MKVNDGEYWIHAINCQLIYTYHNTIRGTGSVPFQHFKKVEPSGDDQIDRYGLSLVELGGGRPVSWLWIMAPCWLHTFVIGGYKYVGWDFLSRSWFLWPGRLIQSQPGGNVTVSGLWIMVSCWLPHTSVISWSKYVGWDFLSRSWFVWPGRLLQSQPGGNARVEMWL